MYQLIRTWVQLLVSALNTVLLAASKTQLQEIDTTLDTGFLPASLSDCTYLIKLENTASENTESQIYNKVKCKIELVFLLASKDITQYQDYIDSYIYPLRKLLNSDNATMKLPYNTTAVSNTISLQGIEEIEMADLNKMDGTYLTPSINFTLEVLDE